MTRKCPAKGFTLLELLVTVVIIGLLIAFVAPDFFKQLGKSEVTSARAQMDSLAKALDSYRLDTGRYPPSETGLKALVEKPAGENRWNGPYLRGALPLDPWGNPFVYRFAGNTAQGFELESFGKDGQRGGQADAADLVFGAIH